MASLHALVKCQHTSRIKIRAYKAHTQRASAFNCVDSGAHGPFSYVMQFLPGRPLPSFSLSMRSQNVLLLYPCCACARGVISCPNREFDATHFNVTKGVTVIQNKHAQCHLLLCKVNCSGVYLQLASSYEYN